MAAAILVTKLYVAPPPPKAVLRPRLLERLTGGLHRKLTLLCAPAGFGKTTLVSEWVAGCGRTLEIIRLIAAGQSNREISQRLYLALSTVKGHYLRILDKLQAQNRTEAVARARELGLL